MQEFEVTIKSNGNGKYPHLKIGSSYKVTAEIKGIFEKIGVLEEPKAEEPKAEEPKAEEAKPKK